MSSHLLRQLVQDQLMFSMTVLSLFGNKLTIDTFSLWGCQAEVPLAQAHCRLPLHSIGYTKLSIALASWDIHVFITIFMAEDISIQDPAHTGWEPTSVRLVGLFISKLIRLSLTTSWRLAMVILIFERLSYWLSLIPNCSSKGMGGREGGVLLLSGIEVNVYATGLMLVTCSTWGKAR